MERTKAGAAVLAMGLGLGACLGIALSHRDAPGGDPAALPAPAAAAAASAAPAPRIAWLSDSLPAQPAALSPALAPALGERLERLAASADPKDAYRAWWLLNACMRWQRDGRLPQPATKLDDAVAEPIADPATLCGALTERMKMARIDYLERAARGGIDEALGLLVEEGPFGDPSALQTRPDDPLVKAWKERVSALAQGRAEQGSWTGLYMLFTGLLFENPAIVVSRQDALAYGIAMRDIMVELDGAAEQEAIPFNGPFLQTIGKDLSPAQAAQASRHAAAIVAQVAALRAGTRQGH
nr:hypothetical protein [uncultured Massilia sp.]